MTNAQRGRHRYKFLPFVAILILALAIAFMAKSCSPVGQKTSKKNTEQAPTAFDGGELLQTIQGQLKNMEGQFQAMKEQMDGSTDSNIQTEVDTTDLESKLTAMFDEKTSTLTDEIARLERKNAALEAQQKQNYNIELQQGFNNLSNYEEIMPLDYQGQEGAALIANLAAPTTTPMAEKIPVYTLQPSMLLKNARLESGIFAQVPNVGNQVRRFYPFYLEVGADNLASQGYVLPGLVGMRFAGEAIGNGTVGCAEGFLTSLTFTFDDGTTQVHSASRNDPLGIITSPEDERGYPCVRGEYITNAPQYLGVAIGLAGFDAAASAFANAQTTSSTNALGGTTRSVNGSNTKFALGNAISGGTDVVQDYVRDRLDGTFDVVVVENKRPVDIRISKVIPIDYDPLGRRLNYLQDPQNISTHWWEALQ